MPSRSGQFSFVALWLHAVIAVLIAANATGQDSTSEAANSGEPAAASASDADDADDPSSNSNDEEKDADDQPDDDEASNTADHESDSDSNTDHESDNEPDAGAEQNPEIDSDDDTVDSDKGNKGTPLTRKDRRTLKADKIALIRFDGEITPMSEQYLYRKLDKAREDNVQLVVIEIDSPGGRLDVLYRMAEHIRDIDWAPTVAYVPNEALSAAALTALACDEIVVGNNARIGDAGVIQYDFVGQAFRYAPEKFRTDLVTFARDLAESKGRSPALAEAMVNMDVEIFRYKNRKTGEVFLFTKEEVKSQERPEDWERLQLIHESRKEHFFEVVGPRAVELGLAEANIANEDALRARYGVKEVILYERTGVDAAVSILNSTFITVLLFIVGLVGLYIEVTTPGIGIGGLLSIVCFSLFFWSRFLGGTAEWLEVILFVAGLILIAIEVFVIPGFGIWGLSGLLLMAASIVLAGQDFVIPNGPKEWTMLRNSMLAMTASFFVFMVAAYFITSRLDAIPIFNRLALTPPEARATGMDSMSIPFTLPIGVGDIGVADSYLRPAGRARFGDEFYDVVSDGSLVDAGKQVRIVSIAGNIVTVREIS
ncbi:MAG: hypothetical protein KDB27_27940 [Planctomycetales bacterium]|nr:hypothetical protein [Planctomycetales bacterium]